MSSRLCWPDFKQLSGLALRRSLEFKDSFTDSLATIRRRKRLSPHTVVHEIGARTLGRHLGRALEVAESSATKWEYEAKIAKRFGFCATARITNANPVPQKKVAPTDSALLRPVHHYLFDIASEFPEMDGETLVKLALLHSRRAGATNLRVGRLNRSGRANEINSLNEN